MLPSQRDLFDIPRDVCYLNSASYSPLPLKTQEAARAAVGRKGQPWRLDAGFAGRQHDRARIAAARLIDADPADVALIPSISYGVATAAKLVTIPRGGRVVVLENDHSSPVLEWQTRADAQAFYRRDDPSARRWRLDFGGARRDRAAGRDAGCTGVDLVGALVRRRPDRHRTGGGRAAAARRLFLIDATQSVGVLPLDVRQLDPDFVIFPTYKWLLGPYGRAFLYVAKRHQDGTPLEQTAAGRRDVRAENAVYLSDISYVGDASRFDMGELDHFVSLEMASIGMEMIAEWGAARHRAASCCPDGADRGRRARSRRQRAGASLAGAAYSEPRLQGWNGESAGRGSRHRGHLRGAAARPHARFTPRLQRRGRCRSFCRGAGPKAAGLGANLSEQLSHFSAFTSVRDATRRPSPRRAEPRSASRSAG